MTFEEFWKENYEKEFGTFEPYYGIASYAFEKGQENCNCVYTDNSNVIEELEKENAELKKQLGEWKKCFLACSSPFCSKHFPTVESSGVLGNMEKKENLKRGTK